MKTITCSFRISDLDDLGAREGPRPPASAVGRLASQAQENHRTRRSWYLTRHREEVGATLDLIEDHEARQRTEGQFGFGQPGQVCWSFEAEVVRFGPVGGDALSDGGLADLSSTDERDDGGGRESLFERDPMVLSLEHAVRILEYRVPITRYSSKCLRRRPMTPSESLAEDVGPAAGLTPGRVATGWSPAAHRSSGAAHRRSPPPGAG